MSGRPAVRAGLAFVGEPHLGAVRHTGWDSDAQRPGALHHPLAAALRAGVIDQLAFAPAAITDADVDELAENGLVRAANLAGSGAAWAGDRGTARLYAVASAAGAV